jgi:hypothetical protein
LGDNTSDEAVIMRTISFSVLDFGFQVITDHKRICLIPQQAYYVVLLVYMAAALCRTVLIVYTVLING